MNPPSVYDETTPINFRAQEGITKNRPKHLSPPGDSSSTTHALTPGYVRGLFVRFINTADTADCTALIAQQHVMQPRCHDTHREPGSGKLARGCETLPWSSSREYG